MSTLKRKPMPAAVRVKRNLKRRSRSLLDLRKRFLGATVWMPIGDEMRVECRIDDLRKAFGRVDVHLAPVSGDGGYWAKMQNIILPSHLKMP